MVYKINVMPPANPYMGLDGTSTMHANAAASNAVFFPGPGRANEYHVNKNLLLDATIPSILMSENGALLCVGVGTTAETASTPMVMLISPKTLQSLDHATLIKPETGNLAGGLYNFIDNEGQLVLVNAAGELQWYSNSYDPKSDTGELTLEKSISIGQPLVVGLVPDYQGRIWFATQGSLSETGPQAVVGFYDPSSNQTLTYNLPVGEMIGNSISSSPSGIAVATTSSLYLFTAESENSIEQLWQSEYENSGVRKPGQLTPGTGSTPVFFGPETGYEFLVITDNATAEGSNNQIPAENVNIYNVSDGSLISQTGFLSSDNSGTENAPIAVGSRIFIPSTYGYWYPPPSETPSTSVPALAAVTFAGGMQGLTLNDNNLVSNWGIGNTILSSALPRLSLIDNLIYTVVAESETKASEISSTTTVNYSFAVIDPDTGDIVGSPYPLGSNSFSGSTPNYIDTSSYTWNTLQMTGVISPAGVFYQGVAGGLFSVERADHLDSINFNLKDNKLFIVNVYDELLDRSPTIAEIRTQAGALDQGSISRSNLVAEILKGEEFIEQHIDNDYYVQVIMQDVFGRPADGPSKAIWVNALNSGLDKSIFVDYLVNSDDFMQLVGLGNSDDLW